MLASFFISGEYKMITLRSLIEKVHGETWLTSFDLYADEYIFENAEYNNIEYNIILTNMIVNYYSSDE